MDVTDAISVEHAVARAVESLGGVDVLIHAAGMIETKPFLSLQDDEMLRHLNVNVMGTLRVCRAVSRMMIGGGGRIVTVTSIHSQIGVAGRAAYAASKGAIAAMGASWLRSLPSWVSA